MEDYDIYVDKDGDMRYDGSGADVELVKGAKLVEQDLRRALEFPQGALPWSKETGSQLYNAINAPADYALVENEMLRIAREDTRIDQASIHITYSSTGSPTLHFSLLGNTTQQEVSLS